MFLGGKKAQIVKLGVADIHGQRFYDVYFFLLDDPSKKVIAARIPVEAVYENPQVGDKVTIEFIMNVPTKVERLSQ